jgi:RNA polymerase sigma factor (sigma-70 family)
MELPDVVQEVFIRAFEPNTRRRFDGRRLYAPYLSQITRNVVVDHLRKKSRQNAVEVELLVDEIALDRANPQSADDFDDWKTRCLVDRYVAQLPWELRRVHEALHVQGLSQREAALVLGVGRQVVRTLESRLCIALRLALEEVTDLRARDPPEGNRPPMVSSQQKAGRA